MSHRRTCMLVLVPSLALVACARDARAETPKPPPGGHLFDVEIVDVESEGAAAVKTHHMLSVSGDSGCSKLDTTSGPNQLVIQACLHKDGEGRSSVEVDVVRSRAGARVRIEGHVPLAAGTRALVGRTDDASRKMDVYLTAS